LRSLLLGFGDAVGVSILRRVVDLMKKHVDETGKPPNVVHVSTLDEQDILSTLDELPSDLKSKIVVDGVRKALPRLYGMRVVWDAAETGVSYEAAPKSKTLGDDL
jgi:hypothetical protein